jgi:hypothetical protein
MECPAVRPGIGRTGADLLGAGRSRRRSDHRLGRRAQGAEGREGVLGQLGVELTGLRGLGDQALVGVLDVRGLDLERLVERLGADELRRFLPNGIVPSRDRERLARWRA